MAYPLLEASHQCRVLYLHSGQWEDDLEGDIHAASIGEGATYAALSYAWEDGVVFAKDDQHVKDTILCNGEILQVSPGLGRALQHLRDSVDLSALWIDKICIDQANDAEREQQIRQMGRIYSNAERVVVWLGESDSNTQAVWDLLQLTRLFLSYQPYQMHHLAFRSNRTDDLQLSKPKYSKFGSVPTELRRIPPASDPLWRAVRAFLERPWLSRVWTLQEVAAAEVCVVMCRHHIMSWDDLRLAAVALQIGGYAKYVLGPGIHAILVRDLVRSRHLSGHHSSLRSLLSEIRGLDSRQGHDKVFGALSLIRKETAARLPVMYATSLSNLYAETVRACIAEDGHLAVLGEKEMRAEGSDMPSWIPDFRERVPCRIMLNESTFADNSQPYRSAGDTEPLMLPSESADILILRGRLIAPITRVLHVQKRINISEASVPEVSRDLDALRWSPGVWQGIYRGAVTRYRMPPTVARVSGQWDALASPGCLPAATHGLSVPDQLVHTLRRTLTADLYPQPLGRLSETATVNSYPAYAAWQARNFDGPAPPSVLYEHDLAVRMTMANRVAFLAGDADDAYLGIGLRTLKRGDWICA